MHSYKSIFFLLSIFLFYNCENKQITSKNGNELGSETSPYLLQHAKNPVNWKAWNENTLKLAKEENKLIIISIGYSACHWCHVMEEESFENDSVAKIMNENFISIKVDREERPDIDNVYMSAVQLMTGSGGWPLNCIALPDGRPIFGGTYFTKDQWEKILVDISKLYKEDPEKIIDFAEKLTEGVKNSELISRNKQAAIFKDVDIKKGVDIWKQTFDPIYGGRKENIKFPMPNALSFLLRYSQQFGDSLVSKHIQTTLTKMAYGGIYDQVDGGFSRYATDEKWHVPHFEKMLYDNAQLVSLYANGYLVTKNKLYKSVIEETLAFVENELTADNGAFYSSLDADSKDENQKLEEGAYYYWTKEELKKIITADYKLFEDYYNINEFGFWEKDRYVLIRKLSNAAFAVKHKISIDQLKLVIADWKIVLTKAREKKIKPNLDDKVLTSWNALMLKGYVDAYKALKDENYLKKALKNADFMINNQLKEDGSLHRNYKNGKSTIAAYSEDYATLIDAFISLYEVTLDEKWLSQSKQLMDYTLANFLNKENSMFYFTANKENKLIARKVKVSDGVISSPNSILANCLFKLSLYYSETQLNEIATQMLSNMKDNSIKISAGYSNWLNLMLSYARPYYEVAIVGDKAVFLKNEFLNYYIPNVIIAGSSKDTDAIPLLKNKFIEDETYIYVCNFGACKLPQTDILKSIKLIDK